MRKALIPMLASLALCGAGTAALIASNGHAQASPRKPVMVALLGDPLMAQNLPDTPPPPNARGASRDFAPDPRQFCDERYAGEVGRMAYLETRLHLSDAEQPLFAHWKDVRLDSAKRQAADCASRTDADRDRADPVARMSREEAMLKQRIADLDTERPAFSALYAALAPDQRQTLAPPRPMMGHDHGPMPPVREMGDLPPPPPPAP
jgi:LTXXQ motif family protein